MKITKYEHACFTVEENGQTLVVDPGNFTTNFVVPDNVAAVVITHEHGDHFDKEKLAAIAEKNQDVIVVAHESITSQLEGLNVQPVMANEGIEIGNFKLEFFGGEHARITQDWHPIPNIGVLINSEIYYPGDSFVVPSNTPIKVLAIPAAAPWMKIAEAVEFLEAITPTIAFPTHDAVLSENGKVVTDKWLQETAEKIGTSYHRIDDAPLEV